MRGKLRDKRTSITKPYKMKRELIERRRTARRENRNALWLSQQLEEENLLSEEAELLEEPSKK